MISELMKEEKRLKNKAKIVQRRGDLDALD